MDLPIIDGRECVPVRLLPFMTNSWPLSSDRVARLFSRREEYTTWSISAFNLRPDGSHNKLLPGQWNRFDDDLTALAQDLQRRQDFEFQWEREWRRLSVERLPASVFVWRDELEVEYARSFGRGTYPTVRPGAREWSEEEEAAECEELSSDNAEVAAAAEKRSMEEVARNIVYHPGDGELNFTPLLSADEEKVAFEGFEFALASSQRMFPPAAAAVPLTSLGAVTAPTPQLVSSPASGEVPEDRQDRRLRELKDSGGDYVEEAGKWRAKGPRGKVADLVRSEKAAGRPMSDQKDVREDLKKAAKRLGAAKAAGHKGNSAFNP